MDLGFPFMEIAMPGNPPIGWQSTQIPAKEAMRDLGFSV